ncbi:MAG: RNA polymerase sigma factor [Phycisphaeraceae bacterium]
MADPAPGLAYNPPMPDADAQADLTQLKDEQLVVAYREGNSAALPELIRRYEKELFHFLIRFAGNRAFAEDLFQEAFLQVHQSAGTFDATKRFKPWLFTIAANKARDHLRREKRRRTAPLSAVIDPTGDSGTSFIDLMEADIALPRDVADDAEVAERVRELADQLPDHLREVLVMAYFHQFAYKEIAQMLSIPLGTVKSRLHAAVGTFAQLWKARHPETADEVADR